MGCQGGRTKKLALLAKLISERPDELRADLMEVYGVCIDTAEHAYPAVFVAALAEQLPQDCRWRVSYDRDAWWTGERLVFANIANSLNGLIWGLADKKARGPAPKLIGPSWFQAGRKSLPATVMSRDALVAELAKPRIKEDEAHG